MARIKDADMRKRKAALQEILENAPEEGLTINEMVSALESSGVELPASKYQAVHIVVKKAVEEGVISKDGTKFSLLDEDDDLAEDEEETLETDEVIIGDTAEGDAVEAEA